MTWFHARLRWAVMAGGEGLRHWEESDCFFRSADWEAAFTRALAIGRGRQGPRRSPKLTHLCSVRVAHPTRRTLVRKP